MSQPILPPLSAVSRLAWAAYVLGRHPYMLQVCQRHLVEILQFDQPRQIGEPWSRYWPSEGEAANAMSVQLDHAIDELVLGREIRDVVAVRMGRVLDRLGNACRILHEGFVENDVDYAWRASLDGIEAAEQLTRFGKQALAPEGGLEQWRQFGAAVGEAFWTDMSEQHEALAVLIALARKRFMELQCEPLDAASFVDLANFKPTISSKARLLAALVDADRSLLLLLSRHGHLHPLVEVNLLLQSLTFLGTSVSLNLFTPQESKILCYLLEHSFEAIDAGTLARETGSAADETTMTGHISRIRAVLKPAAKAYAEREAVPSSVADKAYILTHRRDDLTGQRTRYELAVERHRIRFLGSHNA